MEKTEKEQSGGVLVIAGGTERERAALTEVLGKGARVAACADERGGRTLLTRLKGEAAALIVGQLADTGAAEFVRRMREEGMIDRLPVLTLGEPECGEALTEVLSSVIEYRAAEAAGHVRRIGSLTKILLAEASLSFPEYGLSPREIGVIARAAALHDIGKIAIPDAILDKPGKLTAAEFEVMKTHAVKGCEILAGLPWPVGSEYLRYAYRICRCHHERWDGRGYPDGLKGDEIPVCAQAVGLADAYDALTTDRVYKKAYPHETAVGMILAGECGAFSPKLMDCFVRVGDIFASLAAQKKGAGPAVLTGQCPAGKELRANLVEGLFCKDLSENPRQRSAAKESRENSGQLPPGKEPPRENAGEDRCPGLRALLDYFDSAVVEADPSGGAFRALGGCGDFAALKGDSLPEALASFAETSVHPGDLQLAARLTDGLAEDHGKHLPRPPVDIRVRSRRSGRYVSYEAAVLRARPDDPRRGGVFLVFTRQKRRESQALRDFTVGAVRCAADGFSVLGVNRGFIAMTGYTRREINRLPGGYLGLVHPDEREEAGRLAGGAEGTGEAEYRLMTKDGRAVWVLDKWRRVEAAGEVRVNRALTDITRIRSSQEELRLIVERHRIIMDQTDEIIFEWDLILDTLALSQNWQKTFGYPPLTERVSERIALSPHVFPDDIPVLEGLISGAREGRVYNEGEARLAEEGGRYRWCRIRATTQFDRAGRPVKAVGVIQGVDEEKRRTEALLDLAERDALTKLYNNSAARGKISRLLENRPSGETGAMFIIDLDNFKQINDTYGHMFGDAVLTEIASRLKQIFRRGDIVARIGGDEFLAYLPGEGDQRTEECARAVVEAFDSLLGDALAGRTLSCSVGIARCPRDGTDYQGLYQRCDRALYQAKLLGKNRYVCFDSSMGKPFALPEERAAVTRIESDELTDGTTGLVQTAFKYLYQSADIETAVKAIIELVGRKFNVSRVYIFEDSDDGTTCSNTFEWCNDGVPAVMEDLQNIRYDGLGGDYRAHFNENGVFYCRDISALPGALFGLLEKQGIKSLLQCAIRDDGRFVGYVGFDDCAIHRLWTRSQIDALAFISELLSTFLLKKRAQDKAVRRAEDLRTVLDLQNSWIYIVDPDTYVLRYINRKTKIIAPDARPGMCCYEAFFGRKTPCEICPARNLRQTKNRTIEIYNPLLKVWSMADASLIRWEDRDACLLSCHDVTPYKTCRPEKDNS